MRHVWALLWLDKCYSVLNWVMRLKYSVIPRTTPFFVLRFVFSIITIDNWLTDRHAWQLTDRPSCLTIIDWQTVMLNNWLTNWQTVRSSRLALTSHMYACGIWKMSKKRGRLGNTYHMNGIWWTRGGRGGGAAVPNSRLSLERSMMKSNMLFECELLPLPPLRPPRVHQALFTWWVFLGLPCFSHSSTSVYYTKSS